MARIKLVNSDGSEVKSNEFGLDSGPKFIDITEVPSSATSGTLTEEQMALLNEAPQENYIMFYGEKFIPMDIQDSKNYRVYTHHGETNVTHQDTTKFLYLILTTNGWQIRTNVKMSLYVHEIEIVGNNDLFRMYTHIYSYSRDPISSFSMLDGVGFVGYSNVSGVQKTWFGTYKYNKNALIGVFSATMGSSLTFNAYGEYSAISIRDRNQYPVTNIL